MSEEVFDGLKLLGFGGQAGIIRRVFRQMEIVEEEIRRAQKLFPEKSDLIYEAFPIARSPFLENTELMRLPSCEGASALFRTHVRQLLRNVGGDVDLDRPTMMEVAVIVAKMSEAAPVNSELVSMVMANQETVDAFGGALGHLPTYENVGEDFWTLLTNGCKQAYKSAYGKPRSELFRDALNRGKKLDERDKEKALAVQYKLL